MQVAFSESACLHPNYKGFTSTILNGGSLGDSLRAGVIGGIIGGVTAGFANGIGDAGAWMTSQAGNEFAGLATRTVLHGALSSFMSKVQGGKWSAGFWAGAVGTYLGTTIKTGNNYFGNIAKNAIISGSVSRITGGKFANGAIMGAFRYMFNDSLKHGVKKYQNIGATARWFNEARDYFAELWENGGAINNTPTFKFPKSYYRGMGYDMLDNPNC